MSKDLIASIAKTGLGLAKGEELDQIGAMLGMTRGEDAINCCEEDDESFRLRLQKQNAYNEIKRLSKLDKSGRPYSKSFKSDWRSAHSGVYAFEHGLNGMPNSILVHGRAISTGAAESTSFPLPVEKVVRLVDEYEVLLAEGVRFLCDEVQVYCSLDETNPVTGRKKKKEIVLRTPWLDEVDDL